MIIRSLRSLLRRAGLDLRRYHPSSSHHCAWRLLLRGLKIDLIFDVGANAGQFGEEALGAGFTGSLVSFEPLAAPHAVLAGKASSHPRWTVHPRAAVGAAAGELTIHVAANSVSSSALPILQSHLDAAAGSQTVGTEVVAVVRLDDVAPAYFGSSRAAMLKIDTQGFEWQVLDGAMKTLDAVAAVQLELSLVPLYEGQRLWRDYVDRMERLGFQLYYAYPAFTDEQTGQTFQWDGMFVRKSLLQAGPSSSANAMKPVQ